MHLIIRRDGKAMIKRVWLNKSFIIKTATKWTGVVFGILGFIGTFASLSDVISEDVKLVARIAISAGILFGIWLIAAIIVSIYVSHKRRFKVLEVSNGYHVYVQYGDIFSKTEVNKPEERRNIVIPVNRCFDTKVDDDLISRNTLHGTMMQRLYDKDIYSEETLNTAIQSNLIQQQVRGTSISRTKKRSGNLVRFPAGTVAEVKASDTETVFFLGLSEFDEQLHAHTSNEEYALAIVKLIEFCNERSQKYPVLLPLIGAGASETKKSESDILSFMVRTLALHKDLINCDVHIVVRDSGKESIAITNI